MKNIRRNLFFLLLCFSFLFTAVEVQAVSISKGNFIRFSPYGLTSIGTTHSRTSHKQGNGRDAYCIQVKKNFTTGDYTAENCIVNGISNGLVSTHYVVAGQIVDVINKKDWSDDKKYAYKVAALNVYFKSLNLPISSGSADFTGDEISNIITVAKNNATYYGVSKSKNLDKPTIAVSNKTLKTISGNTSIFVSDKIVFGNLKSKFNGGTPVYTFSTSGSGTIYLCNSMTSNTGCFTAKDIKLSNLDSKAYYLRVIGGTPGSNVSVTITGTSTASYLEGSIYCKGTSNQAVLIDYPKTQEYVVQNKITFQIPDMTNHKISILKVDEYGESVSGAEFELHEKGSNTLLTLSKDGATFTYTTPKIATTEDTFFNKTYCYKETVVPFGYRKNKEVNETCIDVKNEDSTTCYYNKEDGTSEAVNDMDYCNSDISNMCKIVTSVVDVVVKENDNTGDNESGDGGANGEPETQNEVIEERGEPVISSEYKDLTEGGCVAPTNSKVNTETGYKETTYTSATKCVLKKSDGSYEEKDEKYCSSKDHYSLIQVTSGNIFITVPNQENSVIISKKAATGDKEVAGAHLKICTEADYNEKNISCSAAKTIDDVNLSWVSTDNSVEFVGIRPGVYYIVETIPPAGYKLSATTATKFSIDEYGSVKKGDTEVKDNKIVIDNELNYLTISKTDITTNKELPGAKLSICATVNSDIGTDEVNENSDNGSLKYKLDLDRDNNCLPVSLVDGTEATWVSTNEPHVIKGLPAGTYYLVETSAPNGYSTTESILFTMKTDGTLLDGDGNPIGDNKIVMKDAPIKQVPTGMLTIYIVLGITVVVVVGGITAYYYNAKGVRNFGSKDNKTRKN